MIYFLGFWFFVYVGFVDVFSMIFMFIWTISSVIMAPRTALRFRSPFFFGVKPVPPLRTTFRLTPPWTFPLIGTPSWSEPPVICTFCAGRSTMAPSIVSPTFLPISGVARVSSSSTTFEVPALGSDMTILNFVIVLLTLQRSIEVGGLSIKGL